MSRKYETFIDRLIREAMEDGRFANLPTSGKPLNLDNDDEAHVPDELRMAHKILRDNDLAPDWIMEGKALEGKREQILKPLAQAARVYRRAYRDFAAAEAKWAAAQRDFRRQADAYNRKVLTYNLKVPAGVTHRPQLHIEREIQRALERAL